MITLTKIAKLANVSISTASKAFSMSNEVNEETREVIFDIAKQHGCFKKFFKAKYPKLVISIITPEINSSFYSEYIEKLKFFLESRNCKICVASYDFSEEVKKDILEYYEKYSGVDGIIMIESNTQPLKEMQIPIVFTNDNNRNLSETERCGALFDAIKYLKQKNVSKIGFIGEDFTAGKQEAFKLALTKNEIPINLNYICITNERFEKGGYTAMKQMLLNGDVPRAVVCAYDSMAIGAIKCAQDNGFRVPEDIAIMGMDNIEVGRYLTPALATIDFSIKEKSEYLALKTIDKIYGNKTTETKVFKNEFVLRRSFEID